MLIIIKKKIIVNKNIEFHTSYSKLNSTVRKFLVDLKKKEIKINKK